MQARDILINLSIECKGQWEEMFRYIKSKRPLEKPKENISDILKEQGVNVITVVDKDYPTIFKECGVPTFPFVLYYRGDFSLAKDGLKRLTVVGSRNSSKYGEDAVHRIIAKIPNDIIVVSGLAKGIDSVALKSALDSDKKVIAIIGNGIDYCYPEENKELFDEILAKGGLILSEYPPKVEPLADNFRWRNRLLAMISSGVLIGEGKMNSGTRITAGFAVNYNKNVGCIPYNLEENNLCNSLIKDGAMLVESEKDVLDLLS